MKSGHSNNRGELSTISIYSNSIKQYKCKSKSLYIHYAMVHPIAQWSIAGSSPGLTNSADASPRAFSATGFGDEYIEEEEGFSLTLTGVEAAESAFLMAAGTPPPSRRQISTSTHCCASRGSPPLRMYCRSFRSS